MNIEHCRHAGAGLMVQNCLCANGNLWCGEPIGHKTRLGTKPPKTNKWRWKSNHRSFERHLTDPHSTEVIWLWQWFPHLTTHSSRSQFRWWNVTPLFSNFFLETPFHIFLLSTHCCSHNNSYFDILRLTCMNFWGSRSGLLKGKCDFSLNKKKKVTCWQPYYISSSSPPSFQ